MPTNLAVDHADVQSSTYEPCRSRGAGVEKPYGFFHWKRLRKYRGVLTARRTPIQRFWIKTKKVGNCIVWTAAKNKEGYGIFNAYDVAGKRHQFIASRWILEQVVGGLDAVIVAMHSCDNPSCVALQHLSPGSAAVNVADCIAKGRRAVGNAMPHARLNPERVRLIRKTGNTTPTENANTR